MLCLGLLLMLSVPCRLTEAYQLVSRMPLTSPTFAHRLDPHWPLCYFDARGKCNDAACPYQMKTDYQLQGVAVLSDLQALARRCSVHVLQGRVSLSALLQRSRSLCMTVVMQINACAGTLVRGSGPAVYYAYMPKGWLLIWPQAQDTSTCFFATSSWSTVSSVPAVGDSSESQFPADTLLAHPHLHGHQAALVPAWRPDGACLRCSHRSFLRSSGRSPQRAVRAICHATSDFGCKLLCPVCRAGVKAVMPKLPGGTLTAAQLEQLAKQLLGNVRANRVLLPGTDGAKSVASARLQQRVELLRRKAMSFEAARPAYTVAAAAQAGQDAGETAEGPSRAPFASQLLGSVQNGLPPLPWSLLQSWDGYELPAMPAGSPAVPSNTPGEHLAAEESQLAPERRQQGRYFQGGSSAQPAGVLAGAAAPAVAPTAASSSQAAGPAALSEADWKQCFESLQGQEEEWLLLAAKCLGFRQPEPGKSGGHELRAPVL